MIAALLLAISLNYLSAGAVAQRPKPATPAQADIPPEARVDVNTATMEQLLKVPGLTQTWAARIIRFRPYHAKNDLIDRGVVSNEVYRRIKEYVVAHRTKR